MPERDRTAQTEPLTIGQRIVAWWETSTSASEPADLADKIDEALAAEREACAEAAKQWFENEFNGTLAGDGLVNTIRSRPIAPTRAG